MGAAWCAAGLWSAAKPVETETQPDTKPVQQEDPAAESGALQPLQLNMQSPPPSATPRSRLDAADYGSPEVFSTPTAEFPSSSEDVADHRSPDIAPLPCGLTAAAMADAMPAETSGQDPEAANCPDGVDASEAAALSGSCAPSLPMLEMSPLPGMDLQCLVNCTCTDGDAAIAAPAFTHSCAPALPMLDMSPLPGINLQRLISCYCTDRIVLHEWHLPLLTLFEALCWLQRWRQQ